MIRLPVSLLLACFVGFVSGEEVERRQDLLRFINGDQLHGTFSGFGTGSQAIWKRDAINAPIEVIPSQIRQIVLNGGRPLKSLPTLSHVALINGDRIPGVLKSMDDEAVVIDTYFAGEVRYPRNQIGMIAPSPLGGRLVYHGPYLEDEWLMVTANAPEGLKPAPPKSPTEKPDPTSPGRWQFSGSAWYWQNAKPGTALVRKEGMPDRAIFRFNVAWKGRLAMGFAFHADFNRPVPKEPKPQGNAYFDAAEIYGNSYVIQLNGNNVMLCRTGFDETGKPTLEAIRAANFSNRFSESDEAVMELRCNRQTGDISFFVNDEFVTQWSEGPDNGGKGTYAGKGSGFGFLTQGPAQIRISEIAMAEWNGMPDSARSLQVDDQDIILLANGTDRFSGKVTGFKEGAITLAGKYGGFRFPLEDLAEIRFAKNSLAKRPDAPEDDLMIHLYPLGRVSGKAVTGDHESIKLLTPAAGELNVKTDSAVILDFNPSNSFLNDWDEQF